jgi:hypothetical protein
MNATRATLRAVTSWLRESRTVTGLAALPAHTRERAQRANARFHSMIQGARTGNGGHS